MLNRFDYPGAFLIHSMNTSTHKIPLNSLGITIQFGYDSGQNNYSRNNNFYRNEFLKTDSNFIKCYWPRDTAQVHANSFSTNISSSSNSQTIFETNNNECIVKNSDSLINSSFDFDDWTGNHSFVSPNQRYDRFGISASVDRLTVSASGGELYKNHELIEGKVYRFSQYFRRGDIERIMVRDQVADFLVVFDIAAGGEILDRSGSNITDASITQLSDDWYYTEVSFVATSSNALMTLRAVGAQPGQFFDLGETLFEMR